MSNADRIERGLQTLEAYREIARGVTDENDSEAEVVDLLTDLFHYIEAQPGLDLTRHLRTACDHQEAEAMEESSHDG